MSPSRSGLAFLIAVQAAAQSPCGWQPVIGALAGTDGRVYASAIHDDGTGPRLWFAGTFSILGGQPAAGSGTFDGTVAQPFFPGLPFVPTDLLSFDGGGGAVLLAADRAASGTPVLGSGVVRLVNGAWSPLGTLPHRVDRLRVLDDGTGPALHAAVVLSVVPAAADVYRWNGSAWIPLVTGAETVGDMAIHDDGAGPKLFACGRFPALGVLARRDPSGWTTVGPAFSGTKVIYRPHASAMAVLDDGAGPALYIGGGFIDGGIGATHVVRYHAGAFTALGWLGGFSYDTFVTDLAVFDAGGGPRLCAAGLFDPHDNAVLAWTGSSWVAPGGGVIGERPGICLVTGDLGAGPRLWLGGDFDAVAGSAAADLAEHDGNSWSPLVAGASGVEGPRAFAAFDSGGGPELVFAGGSLAWAGTEPGVVGAWNGLALRSLGSVQGAINALHASGADTERVLVAAGQFWSVAGVAAEHIAVWNGVAWSAPGPGLAAPASPYSVRANDLVSFDDGGGARLYVGGNFHSAGGVPARAVARFDGTAFSPVPGTQAFFECVSLAVLPEATGPALYAAASVNGEGLRVRRFDGASWTAVGAAFGLPPLDLAVFDAGAGPRLYAAGQIGSRGVWRLENGAWVSAGAVIASGPSSHVAALHVHDDGRGPALFAGGSFAGIGGVAAANVARYDGTAWSPLAGGADSSVLGFGALDAGAGPALFAGGNFDRLSGAVAPRLGRWSCLRPSVLAVQPAGPGTGALILNAGLTPGGEVFNVFGLPGPGAPGTGPFAGLFGPPSFLLPQILAPPGTPPFHFIASGPLAAHGPFLLPPADFDALCLDVTTGLRSPVIRVTIH